jgi:hypothetical protein
MKRKRYPLSNFHMGIVRQLPCVVCRRFELTGLPVELHHVAEGSGLRSDFAVVPLCSEHHRGGAGLHGMGTKEFIRLYRPPGDSEYGLLCWLLEDLARFLKSA